MGGSWILDATLVPLGAFFILGYHVWLALEVVYHPTRTVVGVNHVNRRQWVKYIMTDNDKKNILAVQTLRSSIMASSLLASTAIVLSSGIAAYISSTSTSASKTTSLTNFIVGSNSGVVVSVKFFSILMCFLFAFFCNIQAIRYTNHVSFLINVPVGPEAPGITPEIVANVLEKGSDFYTIGVRGYYMAFPLLLWLFGPIPMVVTCIVLVPVLYVLDRAGGRYQTLSKKEKVDDAEENVEEGKKTSEGASSTGEEKAIGLHGTNVHHMWAD
eukprot:TRINITY_DN11826_c0_g2_i1.p1 TRINITY_DN11826_c0_g2~~TRINITY_DN11826_c0_g2_i1.p1  ORF type:complete len:271 (+),score=41.42 TRINITY_DN11826_c0_g2_i1:325-1137(+)